MSTIPVKTSQKPSEHVNRACEPCRVLKVRCLPSTDPSSAQCQRCAKNRRTCHYAAPQKRRPRKRTDTRVAELEREVRAMRSLLSKSKQSPAGDSIHDSIGTVDEGKEPENLEGMDVLPSLTVSPETLNAKVTWAGSECDDEHSDGGAERSPDVIERDLICLTRAVKFFDHYNDNMQQQGPLVSFRPDETADSIRSTRPILFLAILTAAAGQLDQLLYSTLHEELLGVFAERYILNCGKSLELVQAFIITAVWLYPPNDFRDLKFYQYVHMAASMVLDIGQAIVPIGPPKPWPIILPKDASKATQDLLKDMEGCCADIPTPAPSNVQEERLVVENKRTFLACYMLCSSVSLSLRRPNMLTYSSATAECIDVLEKSPHALPSDKSLIIWVRMQHIAEECATSISFNDQSSRHAMSDPRMQLILKGFENRLEEYKNSLSPSDLTPTLALHYYTNKIFLQEYAVMVHNGPDFLSPQLQNVKTRPLTTASTNATMTVIESAHFLLDAFLGASDVSLMSYPVINYVRMAYSCVLLIKIFAATTAPNSELGKILDPKALKVDEYLKAIVSRLKNFTEYRVSIKFLQIIVKVAMWHQQHLNSNIAKLGQGHGQLIQPLLNLVMEDARREHEQKLAIGSTLGRDKGNAGMRNENYLSSLEPRTKLGLGSSPDGLARFATDIFSFSEEAPSERSTISKNESTYTQATTATTAASTLGGVPGDPGVAGGDAQQQQWFQQPPDMTYGLLPTDMDMDIFALSEGMEYTAADLSTWLPPDEGWRYPQTFGTTQDWDWGQL